MDGDPARSAWRDRVKIGECESDPIFCITDLLPHLSKEQYKRDLREAISGEALNVLVGSRPFLDDKVSEKVKLNILQLLFEKYDVVEEDLFSAELTAVPAFKAQDLGFDRSMILYWTCAGPQASMNCSACTTPSACRPM